MRIDLITKNYKEGNRLVDVLQNKLSKLDRYFGEEAVARVQLTGVKSDKFTMEISIAQPGMPLVRAEVTTDNMYDNVDIVIPKLEKQIARFRSRYEKVKKSIKTMPLVDVENEDSDTIAETDLGKIVKIKKFEISIISVEEAVAELELLDHNFYVFIDADTNKVSVVYKRHDGDYGLICPEY